MTLRLTRVAADRAARRQLGESEKPLAENRSSSISKPATLGKMGAFWDTHDFTDFDNPDAPDVEFKLTYAVPIELDLLS